MKVFILLFLLTVVTCQAYQLPLRRGLVARQGDPKPNELPPYDQLYEKYKNLTKKYMIFEDPDPETLLVPDVYKPDHLRAHEPDKRLPEPDIYSRLVNPEIDHPKFKSVPSRITNPGLNQHENLLVPEAYKPDHLSSHEPDKRLPETDIYSRLVNPEIDHPKFKSVPSRITNPALNQHENLLVPDVYKPDHLSSHEPDKRLLEPDIYSRLVNPEIDHSKFKPVSSRITNPALNQHKKHSVPDVYKPDYLNSHEPDKRLPESDIYGRIVNPDINHPKFNPVPTRITNPALNHHETLLVPDVYKPDYLSSPESDKRLPESDIYGRIVNPAIDHPKFNTVPTRINNPVLNHQYSNSASSPFTHPAVHTRSLISESAQLRQVALADQSAQLLQQSKADQAARLAEADREALSKLSEEDRIILESRLSKSEREALLAKLEDGKLNDLFPKEENRFGGGFSGAIAQLGASAGGYIGGKLAGTLGAKLGAAAGAYLGAAAASRFVKKTSAVSNIVSNIVSDTKIPNVPIQYSGTYGGYGAVMLKDK